MKCGQQQIKQGKYSPTLVQPNHIGTSKYYDQIYKNMKMSKAEKGGKDRANREKNSQICITCGEFI